VQSADVKSGYKPAGSTANSVTVTRSTTTDTAGTPQPTRTAADKSTVSAGRQPVRTVEPTTADKSSPARTAPDQSVRESSNRTQTTAPSRAPASERNLPRSRQLNTEPRSTAQRPDSGRAAARSRVIAPDRGSTPADKSITRSSTPDAQRVRREESDRRGRLAGTERISARPSEAYRNRPMVTASAAHSRPARTPDNSSRLIINGDNNVIVQGDITTSRPRPYIAPRLYRRDVFQPRRHNHWHDHGLYFSFTWSTSSCGRVIWAPYQSHWGFSYYYPRYHRKYVFVSIGGFWPTSYRYRRYYWYGCHPHYWYGTHIVEQPVVQNTTYNTYNYYGTSGTTTITGTSVYENPPLAQTTDVVDVIDAPTDESVVDICFAHGVKVFSDGNYTEAIERFRRAVQMDPDDVILPFTYSQALFADGDYALAAGVLRGAIQNIPEDELTIYYPRGLYEDEAVLTEQIQRLESAIAGEPFVSDYQLLLGYQYLGLGELQKARAPLAEASKDIANQFTAGKLLELADRLEAEQAEIEK